MLVQYERGIFKIDTDYFLRGIFFCRLRIDELEVCGDFLVDILRRANGGKGFLEILNNIAYVNGLLGGLFN
jgi:hypothetical protein